MAKLAAFDMDGTLLMPDHRLGEKTLSALKRLRERDITLTFATGRHFHMKIKNHPGHFAVSHAHATRANDALRADYGGRLPRGALPPPRRPAPHQRAARARRSERAEDPL